MGQAVSRVCINDICFQLYPLSPYLVAFMYYFCSNDYVVHISVRGPILRIELEDPETVDRWSGEFSSQCKPLYAFHFAISVIFIQLL